MMQDGLHIGLAAWINRQRNANAFVAFPALPVVTSLVDLEAMQNVQDVGKAAEFARLVNFIPRQGQWTDTFSASSVLWDVHRTILNRMDFATTPWTTAEQAEYTAAREVLYTTDSAGLPAPSPRLLLYEELKAAYHDVVRSNGSADDIAQAMSAWLVRGSKLDIENALEAIQRLSARSSRNQAQNEALALSVDPQGVGLRVFGDMVFAPTYFAPISALFRDTWMEATVSFADLDSAVGSTPPASDKWRAYRANRWGDVTFEYVVLTCLRPWYTPMLYQRDDWRLDGNSSEVSKGNGTDGLLPAYVDAVYLVSVKNVTTSAQQPESRPLPNRFELVAPLQPLNRLTMVNVATPIAGPKSLDATVIATGVVRKGATAPVAFKATNTHLARPVRNAPLDVGTVPEARFRLGEIRQLTQAKVNRRYLIAQAYLEQTPLPTPETTATTEIYVVGFGCEKLPFAPNPNVNYQW